MGSFCFAGACAMPFDEQFRPFPFGAGCCGVVRRFERLAVNASRKTTIGVLQNLLLAEPQWAHKLSLRGIQFLPKESICAPFKTIFGAGKAHQMRLDLAAPQAFAYVIVSD
jgi:hypothetical protein